MLYWVVSLFALLFYFYFSYWKKKGAIPGPVFPIPFFGEGIQLISDPNKFWSKQAELGPVSCSYLFGKFMVFLRDNELSKGVLLNQNTEAIKLIAEPFNSGLFGENNLIHMKGNRHKFFRQQFVPLFTSQKLDAYFKIHKEVVWNNFLKWNESKNECKR